MVSAYRRKIPPGVDMLALGRLKEIADSKME